MCILVLLSFHLCVVSILPEKTDLSSPGHPSPSSVSPPVGHELISGLTQFLILLILRRGPLHGYELTSLLEPVYGRRLSPGTIYPLLQRMEHKEYLLSHNLLVAGRKRKTYLLTRLGRIALENALSALRRIVSGLSSDLSVDDPGFELLKSLAQYRILFILDQSPLHGYDLVDRLANFFGRKIALGTIYPSLYRLVEKQYIVSSSQFDGDRERKVYELTPLGREALRNAHKELLAIVDGKIFS